MRITSVSGAIVRVALRRSMPLTPGIMRSVSSTSMRCLRITSSASRPAGAVRPWTFSRSKTPAPASPGWTAQQRLAISDNGDDTLAFVSLDLPTPKVLGYMPIGDVPVEREGPHHLAVSPEGKYLYVPLSNYVPGSGTGPHGSHG